jgi:hypothetical protein
MIITFSIAIIACGGNKNKTDNASEDIGEEIKEEIIEEEFEINNEIDSMKADLDSTAKKVDEFIEEL